MLFCLTVDILILVHPRKSKVSNDIKVSKWQKQLKLSLMKSLHFPKHLYLSAVVRVLKKSLRHLKVFLQNSKDL